MRVARLVAPVLAATVLLVLAGPAPVRAAAPPNPNDPCVSGTRDVCGTTGVGFYKSYRYGTRWFGDFRGAVPGELHQYCIDLRFWYPGADYAYRETPATGLRNRDGEAVSVASLERMAYAIWTYGRTNDADTAAAVMLYVHSQMGDARPGELEASAIGAGVATLYERVSREAARFHGPYRVTVTLPSAIGAGKTGAATIRVVSGTGAPLPNVALSLDATGATGVPATVTTNAGGVATVPLRATGAAGVHLTATTEPLAATLPRIFRPSKPAPAVNGQRLASAESQRVSSTDTSTGQKAQLALSTAAAPSEVISGGRSTDRVTLSGALASYQQRIAVRLYGPFRDASEITCTGPPFFTSSFPASGSGAYTTSAATVVKPGFYQYQETAPSDAAHAGLTTPCNTASERVRVVAQPTVHTVAGPKTVAPGGSVSDTLIVSGLAGERATVQAALYGPFPARDAVGCSGTPVWTGTVDVPGDGTYTTAAYALTTPGYYVYAESIAASDFVKAVKTPCADVAETTVLRATPALRTRISAQRTAPGTSISDTVTVSGAGRLELSVQAALYGPFATRAAIACAGTPYWHGSVVAKGDGTYRTAPVKLEQAGYYTYRESIAASEASSAVTTVCADTAETTLALARPKVTTAASSEVVYPGSSISDRVLVTGLGKTTARIRVELFGPFSTRAAIGCTKRVAATVVTARGDGVLRTPPFRLAGAGFYTFREQLIGTPLVTAAATGCAETSETALASPEIVTGRGDVARNVLVHPGAAAPARVRVASLGIDAPVAAVGIDLVHGVLGVPASIHRTGWWKDGAAPGARSGSILIAGHVDSAAAGAGAFFGLHTARAGARVTLTTASGRTFTYRVVSVRNYPKQKLPTDVYSLKGRPRLVLVTCGGPFIAAQHHYRDNVVLTAVPA